MFLSEYSIQIPPAHGDTSLLKHFEAEVATRLPEGVTPIRFAVTEGSQAGFHCEIGVMSQLPEGFGERESIFRFVRRTTSSGLGAFNVALVVPTGIGAEIGGHAGDAGPVVRMLGAVCDAVITHPNVVNASDVNEIPENGLYVEGSVLSRFLMGTVGLLPVRANRILVIIDRHSDELFVSAAVNTVNAARTSYGLDCSEVVQLDPPIRMSAAYAESGRAAGTVEGLERLCSLLASRRAEYDAVAISSVINVPPEYHSQYFEKAGDMVNPWGGVEAMLTHAVSVLLDVPSAHSPMFESREVSDADPGVVDPRMAAEAVSLSFLQSALKGLQRSPRLVTDPGEMSRADVLTSSNVSALIVPDGCLGLPTLAALEQGIPVIAVRENRNLMQNDLTLLPWEGGGFYRVENYWEAVGVVSALKAGVAAEAVRRPIQGVELSTSSAHALRKPIAPRSSQSAFGETPVAERHQPAKRSDR